MWTQADIESAKNELSKKTLETIQTETAKTWGARALAAYALWQSTNEGTFLSDALEYRHESLEHAALAGRAIYLQVHDGLSVLEAFL